MTLTRLQEWIEHHSMGWRLTLMLAPLFLLLFFCIVVPLTMMFVYSFWRAEQFLLIQEWNIGNYVYILSSQLHLQLTGKALLYGLSVTLLTMILAYPVAYFLARYASTTKVLWIHIIIIPLFTSVIIRYFAWRRILGSQGLVNDALINLGLTDSPLPFLGFGPFASVISLAHVFLPFMILALWASIESIEPGIIQAARDLGASWGRIFTRIIFPLSMPGLIAGTLFVFVPVTGEYFGVNLMGGTRGITITNVINDEFTSTLNWPMGSAMSFTLLAMTGIVLLCLLIYIRRRKFVCNYLGET